MSAKHTASPSNQHTPPAFDSISTAPRYRDARGAEAAAAAPLPSAPPLAPADAPQSGHAPPPNGGVPSPGAPPGARYQPRGLPAYPPQPTPAHGPVPVVAAYPPTTYHNHAAPNAAPAPANAFVPPPPFDSIDAPVAAEGASDEASPPPTYADDVGCWEGFADKQHKWCALLTILLVGMIVAIFVIPSDNSITRIIVIVIAVIVYLIYMREVLRSDTYDLLTSVRTSEEMAHFHEAMERNGPVAKWHITCYHTERYTDGNGNRRSRTVTTHVANEIIPLARWHDRTTKRSPTSHSLCQVRYNWVFTWGDVDSQRRHKEQYLAWVALNKRDMYQTKSFSFDVAGFEKLHLEVADGQKAPWWFSRTLFVLISAIGLSWPYRVIVASVTGRREETVHKVGWWDPPQQQPFRYQGHVQQRGHTAHYPQAPAPVGYPPQAATPGGFSQANGAAATQQPPNQYPPAYRPSATQPQQTEV